MAIFMFTGASGRPPRLVALRGAGGRDRRGARRLEPHPGRPTPRCGTSGAASRRPAHPAARQLLKPKVFAGWPLAAAPLEERRELARALPRARRGRRSRPARRWPRPSSPTSATSWSGGALPLPAGRLDRPDAARDRSPAILRKDYTYLFERFFYSLDDTAAQPLGLVVGGGPLDPDARLRAQLERYFRGTLKGRQRSSLVLPEPLLAAR